MSDGEPSDRSGGGRPEPHAGRSGTRWVAGRRNAQIRSFRATVAAVRGKPVTANGLHYSVGMTITQDMQEAIVALPARI